LTDLHAELPKIETVVPAKVPGKGMSTDKKRDALLTIGKHLRTELDRQQPQPKPNIERALRRLLERDIAERSRPSRRWTGEKH